MLLIAEESRVHPAARVDTESSRLFPQRLCVPPVLIYELAPPIYLMKDLEYAERYATEIEMHPPAWVVIAILLAADEDVATSEHPHERICHSGNLFPLGWNLKKDLGTVRLTRER